VVDPSVLFVAPSKSSTDAMRSAASDAEGALILRSLSHRGLAPALTVGVACSEWFTATYGHELEVKQRFETVHRIVVPSAVTRPGSSAFQLNLSRLWSLTPFKHPNVSHKKCSSQKLLTPKSRLV